MANSNKAKTRKNLTIKQIAKIAVPILKINRVTKAGIFGSYARGEAKKKSDIDLLVKYPKGIGFGFAGIELELEKKLRKRVDLLTYNSIHPLFKKKILDEEVRII